VKVRSIVSRPVATSALAAVAAVALLGGIGLSFFRSTPASAAAPVAGSTSVEAALGVAPSGAALAAVSDKTTAGLATAATVTIKAAPALSASSLPLVRMKHPAVKATPKKAAAAPTSGSSASARLAAKARLRARVVARRVAVAKRIAAAKKAAARKKTAARRPGSSRPAGCPAPSGSGAERWRPVVRWYLKRAGVWNQTIEDKAIHIINGESSGDPSCIYHDYVGLFQFNSEWASTATRLDPYWSIARFVQVYKEGGMSSIRHHWSPTF
jgi:hypothetical protein